MPQYSISWLRNNRHQFRIWFLHSTSWAFPARTLPFCLALLPSYLHFQSASCSFTSCLITSPSLPNCSHVGAHLQTWRRRHTAPPWCGVFLSRRSEGRTEKDQGSCQNKIHSAERRSRHTPTGKKKKLLKKKEWSNHRPSLKRNVYVHKVNYSLYGLMNGEVSGQWEPGHLGLPSSIWEV